MSVVSDGTRPTGQSQGDLDYFNRYTYNSVSFAVKIYRPSQVTLVQAISLSHLDNCRSRLTRPSQNSSQADPAKTQVPSSPIPGECQGPDNGPCVTRAPAIPPTPPLLQPLQTQCSFQNAASRVLSLLPGTLLPPMSKCLTFPLPVSAKCRLTREACLCCHI